MSTTAWIFIIVLAVVVAGVALLAWWVDARRAKRLEHDTSRVEQGFDEKQLHHDEEEYTDFSTDPRNRMR